MSAAVEILAECHARGIRIQPAATPGNLRLAPKRAIDPVLLEKVRQHKQELLILVEIARIEPEALRWGWRSERLWNASFWPHSTEQPRGLAAVLDPGDRILEVTGDYMLIEKSNSRSDRLRFWRMDG